MEKLFSQDNMWLIGSLATVIVLQVYFFKDKSFCYSISYNKANQICVHLKMLRLLKTAHVLDTVG